MKKIVNWDGSFYIDVSIYNDAEFMVGVGKEICEALGYSEGSFAVLPSRLMGLDYADYCRMCRDVYHGTLYGKAGKYIGISFANKSDAENLYKELTKRWEYAKQFIQPR